MPDSPKEDAVCERFEKTVVAGVHGYDMLAVRVILQGFVYPVDKSHFFFLWKQKLLVAKLISQNSLRYKNIFVKIW